MNSVDNKIKFASILRKEISKKLNNFAALLKSEGLDKTSILKMIDIYIKSKIFVYYQKLNEPTHISDFLAKRCLKELSDSKAEVIFGMMLWEEKISFQFQHKIGPYRVDFLLKKDMIVEIDGPIHNNLNQIKYDDERDAYLKMLGYEILRLPIWVVSILGDVPVKEIKNYLKEKSNG